MVKITHPSMRRGRDTSVQNPPETFVVEDVSGDPEMEESQVVEHVVEADEEEVDELEERLRQFETGSRKSYGDETTAAPYSNAPIKSKMSKKTLEDLLFAGRVNKEFTIASNKYALSTLTNKEHNMVVKELYNLGDSTDVLIIKTLTLALALKSINNVSLDDIEVDGTFDSDLYRRKEIVDNLQLTVVERIYELYSGMVEESQKLVQGEDLKNS